MGVSVVSPQTIDEGWSHLCDYAPANSSILVNVMVAIDDGSPVEKLVRNPLWSSMTDEGDNLVTDLTRDRCKHTDNQEANIKQIH